MTTEPIVAPQAALPVVPGPIVDPIVKAVQSADQIVADKKAADAKIVADAAAITKAAEEATAKEREGWQKEYVTIDNADAQAAIDVMKEGGVTPLEANAIFAKAIESKKLTDIDWASLEAKIGAGKTRLVRNGINQYFTDVVNVQTAVTEQAYEIMGGQENWTTVRAWAHKQEAADPTFAKRVGEYRKAIDSGGFAAEAAVKQLRADYEADPKNGGLGQNKITRGETVVTNAGDPMTRQQYVDAIKVAEASRRPQAELQALHSRRRAGMAKGI